MSKFKLGGIIIAIISILIIAAVAICLYAYWPAIKGTVDKSKYYTQEDLQNSYNDGYSDGNKSESELTAKCEYYRTLVDDYYGQVDMLNKELSDMTLINYSYEKQINTLKENKAELENLVKTLQNNNLENADTIKILNSQIATLQNQINEMNEVYLNYSSQIKVLNNKIKDLQDSIKYYESFIANLESGDQVVVTFEFDGSVYNIQILNKGSKISIVEPQSTDYVIFNGWMVDGEIIDLNNYFINNNIKLVADVTYKYLVEFKVDNELFNSQFVVKNGCVDLVDIPTLDGFSFEGWTINGVNVIDISSYEITENTTFIAKFKQLHKIDFIVNNEIYESRFVSDGNKLDNLPIPTIDGYKFLGWTCDGVNVVDNINNSAVFSDVQYIAKFVEFGVKFTEKIRTLFPSYSYMLNSFSNIIFDKYSNSSKEYYVNDVNVIRNIEPNVYEGKTYNLTDESSDVGFIDFYCTSDTLYILSDYMIYFYGVANAFSSCSKIINISFNNCNFSHITSMRDMFKSCFSLQSLDVSNFNTSNVTDMHSMFEGCKNLQSLDVSSFNTSKVTTMSYMFSLCSSLQSLDLSNFDTSNVIFMSNMFFGCSNLQSLDVLSFNTSKVTTMSYMFYSCNELSTLDLSSFDTGNVTNMGNMFSNCDNLQVLDLSNFSTLSNNYLDYMFYKCINLENIYVGLKWSNKSLPYNAGYEMFRNCYKLPNCNGAGNAYYAHTGEGGYFTLKV